MIENQNVKMYEVEKELNTFIESSKIKLENIEKVIEEDKKYLERLKNEKRKI